MQCLEIARGVFEGFAFGQTGTGCRDIDYIRTQAQRGQLKGCTRPGARFDEKVYQRLSAQGRDLLDLTGSDLLKRVGGFQNEIDFVSRQVTQAKQIFAIPAWFHDWGAQAASL